ncbi:arg8-vasotocin receptor-like [Ornithodoros turicata]|uniref:arg8-vasotocin receptor-like n=1 Tax=Ornithodoros turicata TaxID=34597 RepID=UPI003139AB19
MFGPRYAGTVRIVIITVMILLSLIGNSVVCWRLLTSRRHRYFKAQILFLNLALADLLVTTVTMSSQLVWEVMGRLWIAGDVFCRMFKVLQTFALVSSTYMLVSIAVERHFAIVNPLSPCPRSRSLAGFAWLFSLIPSLPNIYLFRLVTLAPGKCYCASLFYIDKNPPISRQMYMAFVCTTVFIIPLLLLIILYGNILLEIWRLSSCGPVPQNSTLPRARVKTLKMTVIIFVAFVVTNVPYMVQEMVLAFAENVSLDQNVVAIFGVISASNSAVNPYVYLSFNMRSGCWGAVMDRLTGQSKSSCERSPVLIRFKANPPSCRGDSLASSTGVYNSCHSRNCAHSLAGSSTSHKAVYYNIV